METLIICSTVVVLTVAILLFVFYSRPFEDKILRVEQFYNKKGVYYKEVQVIERTYIKSGAKKIITKHIDY